MVVSLTLLLMVILRVADGTQLPTQHRRSSPKIDKNTAGLTVEQSQATLDSVSQATQPVQTSLSPQNTNNQQEVQITQNALQPASFKAD